MSGGLQTLLCAASVVRRRVGIVAVVFALWVAIAPAAAEKRVALVIGNSDYREVAPLENPRNDAEDVGTVLKRLGFDTTVALDADRTAMEKVVEDFAAKVEGADVALFYYAGHAMQHQGVNYLMPIDANLQNAAGLRRLTKLNDIVSDVKRAKALRIMILDACRDNPLAERLESFAPGAVASASRSVGLAKLSRSLARSNVANDAVSRGGDIIVYAAEAGRTAADGVGRNSPFSAAFLRYVETEGQEVVALMRRVTTNVQQETNGEQRPELSLAVPFEFYFKPGPPQPPPTVQQLLPNAKPHEVAAIEAQIEVIVNVADEKDRDQIRREVIAQLTDLSARSGLKADQLATELPKAYARLARTRKEIEEFRQLMENEPGIAPFIEIAAAAVASGRRPDLQAAGEALAQAHARYDEAVRQRTEGLNRARSNRAAIAEQRGKIAETEYRTKEAAEFYLAAAKDTPEAELENTAQRFAFAGSALFEYGTTFFANESLKESIRVLESEALPRYDRITTTSDEQARKVTISKALVLAQIADAQTKLGSRLPGLEGARMMVDARATYAKALQRFKIEDFPYLAMNILDRRSSRDIEFGRRITSNRGRDHFAAAVNTRRLILSIHSKPPVDKDELGQARNNLAYALQESSRRIDGEEGDKQIDEAIGLLQQALDALETTAHPTAKIIARANLAQAFGLRAGRKPGLAGQADIDEARALFARIDTELEKDKDPRLWAVVKQFEAEFLRMVGERITDRGEGFQALKSSFDLYQTVLSVISRETAPNDWAMVCAEMGYTIVSALPLLGESDRERFAKNAVGLFGNARPYFIAGGFGQDLQRLDAALETAVAAANTEPSAPAPSRN